MKTLILVSFILASALNFISGQSDDVNLLILSTMDDKEVYLEEFYRNKTNGSHNYIDGAQYVYYFVPHYSSPLLHSNSGIPGTIISNGKEIDNLLLKYDTYKDKIILVSDAGLTKGRSYDIDLNQSMVDGFALYVNKDTLNFRKMHFKDTDTGLPDGYYNVVYDMVSTYFIKHGSIIVYDQAREKYLYNPVKYLRVNGKVYSVSNRKSFYSVFGNNKDEVKRYCKKSGIVFRKITNDQMVSVLKHIDDL
jgi:hypothetical protein